MSYQKIVRYGWMGLIGGILFTFIFVLSVIYNVGNLYGELPSLDLLEDPKSEFASEVFSSDGVLLGKYFRENRSPVSYEDLSPNLVNALISTEDERFHDHSGIDLQALYRVLFKTLILRKSTGGGSTLSQQTAKNLFNMRREEKYEGLLFATPLRLPIIKIKEWITAVKIEKSYTKKEILTMYLNTVDFGSNSFGIKTAAKTFFNTTPLELNVQQAAMLVGLLQAPSKYNPIRNPERAVVRRRTVLGQMLKAQKLTKQEMDSIHALSLGVSEYEVENHNKGIATYFREELKKDLKVWCKDNGYDIYADGLKVYTTIDSRMQKHAEEAMVVHMAKLQKRFFKVWKGQDPWRDKHHKVLDGVINRAIKNSTHYKRLKERYDNDTSKIMKVMRKERKMRVFTWENDKYEKDTVLSPVDSVKYHRHFLHTGMVVSDPYTGKVKVWVGGINFKRFQFGHVRSASGRQPGSTFKPFLYCAAINEGLYSPCSKVLDVPTSVVIKEEPVKETWTANNSYGHYTNREYTLRKAMGQSINSVAAQLVVAVTPEKLVQYAKDNFKISTELQPVPSLCLGTSDVKLLDMVAGYSVFVNKGYYIKPSMIERIEDKNGNVIYTAQSETHQALSEETAYTMLHMLKGPTEERGGTATGLWRYKFRQNNDVGGKTGTTSNYSDGWFMGVTKEYVAGVWVGAEDRSVHFKSIGDGQGARMAMPIFAEFSEKVYADSTIGLKKGLFSKPQNFELELDCSKYKEQNLTDADSVIDIMPSGDVDSFDSGGFK